jgi:photosystem II stability/assembly factor-like uncharacterized protein
MAADDQSGFVELLRSPDGGQHWHDVTPPAVVAGEDAFYRDQAHAAIVTPLTPFVLDSRTAWLPVLRSYGHLHQASELYVYTTSDAGRRWVLHGRFPHGELGGLFFLSPSTGFIETGGDGAMGEDPAQIYATSDGGLHWREASASSSLTAQGGSSSAIGAYCDKNGVSFASPRVGFASGWCGHAAYLQRTSDGGGKWGYLPVGPDHGGGTATFPPVFSSPEAGSMVVAIEPEVLFATTIDAGRHWDLRHLPPGAARLLSADATCLPGCLDVVSARTWVVEAGHEMYTTTDAGLSWRASSSPIALSYLQQPGFLTNLQLDFLGPRVGWAYEGNISGVPDARSALVWRTSDGGQHWSTYSCSGVVHRAQPSAR